ncbi:MAG: glycosyltransferase family 39 protein [Planctomycetota bacterium]
MTNNNWKAGLLGLALLAGLGILCPLLMAPYIPLVDPDEGLHAAIAQEMIESGDWIVPHLLNEPFLDKPILYFWAIAASLSVFGMSEVAVRLPGLLFGMLGTLTTAVVAWRLLGRRTGLIAGVFYASMIVPLALIQLPAHDAALVPWVNLALLCFWESDRGGFARQTQAGCLRYDWHAWAWTVVAGVVLGLAILTKGLLGVVLVGIAYGGYLIVSRRLRAIHCFRAGLALTVAAIIGSSWYLAVEQSNPGFLRYYFFERHVLGFFTSSQPHGVAPWWYYFPILIAGGIPWIAYLPVLFQDALSRWRNRIPAVTDDRGNRPLLLLACWFIGCTLFLMVSRSKLITYIWPVFPAMAILTAIVWARKIDGVLSDGAKHWMGRIVWCTCLIGPFCLPTTFAITQIALPTQFSPLAWTLAVMAGLTSLVPLWGWLRGRDHLTLGLGATTVCGQLVVLLLFAFPQVAAGLSGHDLAVYFNGTRELPSRMLMAQERVGSFIFYLDHDLRSQLQLSQIVNQDITAPLPTPALGTNEWLVIPERHLLVVLNNYDLSSLPYQQAGRFRLYRRSDIEPRALIGQTAGR